ncbi:MAG: ABC transporter permease [Chloroflexi bacterium]|nr:ABC transporter permease [Chloroflexota bacterium]
MSSQSVALEMPRGAKMRGRLKRLGRVARQKPLGAISAVVLLVIILSAIFAPLVSPHDPLRPYNQQQLTNPSKQFPLGTDGAGRDILSRLIYGARTSLTISFTVVGIGIVFGTLYGLVTGYFMGVVDMVGQRVVDAIQSIPSLVLALAIVAVLGQSTTNVIIALLLGFWTGTSRIIRGQTLTTKENTYVEAARAIGCSNIRVMLRHIAPQVYAPAIIVASVLLGQIILAEASLSFLGMGTPPPAPSWGRMLDTSTRGYMIQAPLITLWPGVAIVIVVLAFNLLGDALRDILDPRLRTGG